MRMITSRSAIAIVLIAFLLGAGFGVGTTRALIGSVVIDGSGTSLFPAVDADAYSLAGVSITSRLQGLWGATSLSTTGSVTAGDLNFTSEFFYGVNNRTDVLANPEQLANYIIFKSGSITYAKNGGTGQIDYKGTDAATVIQDAIDALPDGGENEGGLIFFKPGTYTLTDRINITTDGVVLSAAYSNSYDNKVRLVLGNNVNKDMIYCNNILSLKIEGLVLQGNSAQQATGNGISWYNVHLSIIKDVEINDCKVDGLYIDSADTSNENMIDHLYTAQQNLDDAIDARGLVNTWVQNCYVRAVDCGIYIDNAGNIIVNNFFGIGAYGISGGTGADHTRIIGNYLSTFTTGAIYTTGAESVISNNYIYNSSIGIFVNGYKCSITGNTIVDCIQQFIFVDGADYYTITGNYLKAANANAGTYLAYLNGNYIDFSDNIIITDESGISVNAARTNVVVSHNIIDGPVGSGIGIFLHTTCDYVILSDNTISDFDQKVDYDSTGTHNEIHHNIGFVTENSFSGANTTATTAVINHGLAGAADYVWCSFNTTTITGWSWTSTATQVTITVAGAGLPASWTCYVRAEYDP